MKQLQLKQKPDFYIRLFAGLVMFSSLLLPLMYEQPSDPADSGRILFAHEAPAVYIQLVMVIILVFIGRAERTTWNKVRLTGLTLIFVFFIVAAYAVRGWGMPYVPELMIGFYVLSGSAIVLVTHAFCVMWRKV